MVSEKANTDRAITVVEWIVGIAIVVTLASGYFAYQYYVERTEAIAAAEAAAKREAEEPRRGLSISERYAPKTAEEEDRELKRRELDLKERELNIREKELGK